MLRSCCLALCAIVVSFTAAGADTIVNGDFMITQGDLFFRDGTMQNTAQVKGPAGPQGPTGPQGPIGPQGPAGPPGPNIQNFDALAGLPCNVTSGFNGKLSISYDVSGTIVLKCLLDFTTMKGTWSGTWHNTTYGSTGGATLVISGTASAQAVLTLTGNVFGMPAPAPITLTAPFSPTQLTFSATGTSIGDVSASLTSAGVMTGAVTKLPNPSLTRMDLTGSVKAASMSGQYTITPTAGGSITGTFAMTKQ